MRNAAQLLASLLGAIVHDFNHPGTNNTHEVKIGSRLAVLHSDASVLEHHHLASSFTVLKTKGTDVLTCLTSEQVMQAPKRRHTS